MVKICIKCKVEQPIDCFYKDKKGLRSDCKTCKKSNRVYPSKEEKAISNKKYRMSNPEKNKEYCKRYYEANRDLFKSNSLISYRPSKEERKEYEYQNREKIAERVKSYRLKNKEKIADRCRLYRLKNLDRINKYTTEYRNTPIGRAIICNHSNRRRTLKKQGDVTNKQLLELQQSATHCFWCQVDLKVTGIHIDHLVPLSKGGEHSLYNLVVSCPSCNLRKGAKDPLEFAKIIFKEEIK